VFRIFLGENGNQNIFPTDSSGLGILLTSNPGATRFAALRACPWLPYFAPSALVELYDPFQFFRLAATDGEAAASNPDF
jgi:hypothetical protein